jgi:hypothetical protein
MRAGKYRGREENQIQRMRATSFRKSSSCNRPWRPIGLWDVEAPTFSRQSAHRWQWGCQPYAPAALYPRKIPAGYTEQEVLGRTNRLLFLIRHVHIENDATSSSSIVACVFVTVVTFLPSRCLATIWRFLPNRGLATIRRLLRSRFLATTGEFYQAVA